MGKPGNRTGAGQFRPGQSGNPHGRPKVATEFRERCRQFVDAKVIDTWVREVEIQGENWMKASELLAAYGYGKPTQPVEHSGSLDTLTDEQVEARYRALIAKGAASATKPPQGGEY